MQSDLDKTGSSRHGHNAATYLAFGEALANEKAADMKVFLFRRVGMNIVDQREG